MEDLRAKTILFCAALALAIALSVILRGRKTVYLLFAAFAGEVALWWASQSLVVFFPSSLFLRVTAVLTVLLPQFAAHLFQAILPEPVNKSRRPFTTVASILGIPLLLLQLSPYHRQPVVIGLVYVYVFGFLVIALVRLFQRATRNPSRAVRARVRFLVAVGALATAFTMADFVSFLGIILPPIGAVLSIVFLFVLSESLLRPRLADLFDMVGRLLVSTALAFCLAGIFYFFVSYIGQYTTLYNAVLAAIVFTVLFDPLRTEVEKRIRQFLFRERIALETSVTELKRELAHSLQSDEIVENTLSGIERSRRVTSAAIYFRDADGNGFDLMGSIGSPAPKRIELLALRPLVDRLVAKKAFSLEELARDAQSAKEDPVLASSDATLGAFKRSIAFGIFQSFEGASVLAGFVLLLDERSYDAFSPEDIALFAEIGPQMGVALANAKIYGRMKEKDRLAALGAMSAGLAHEIKNPLGAIKGAAQLLEEEPNNPEFVGIIIEEVDRLNRVVGSFLDYARPHAGNPIPLDVNAAVKRTIQILSSQTLSDVDIITDLDESVSRAKIDPEQFRQVLMNLLQNGIQAMDGGGTLTVTTTNRKVPQSRRSSASIEQGGAASERSVRVEDGFVEIAVRDTGPGIAQQVLKNLFVPFFTTKQQGTGLGLAISQSLIQNVGGRIEVVSHAGSGTTFTLIIPSAVSHSLMPGAASPGALEPAAS